jgi:hypothetical protein
LIKEKFELLVRTNNKFEVSIFKGLWDRKQLDRHGRFKEHTLGYTPKGEDEMR